MFSCCTPRVTSRPSNFPRTRRRAAFSCQPSSSREPAHPQYWSRTRSSLRGKPRKMRGKPCTIGPEARISESRRKGRPGRATHVEGRAFHVIATTRATRAAARAQRLDSSPHALAGHLPRHGPHRRRPQAGTLIEPRHYRRRRQHRGSGAATRDTGTGGIRGGSKQQTSPKGRTMAAGVPHHPLGAPAPAACAFAHEDRRHRAET